jgi:hypothetical protein
MAPEEQASAPQANPEEEAIGQIIQMIGALWAESQRQLMWFLQQEFANVVGEEKEATKASPQEQERKADVMSEAF